MRAKFIYEALDFERGRDPKEVLFGPRPGDILVDNDLHAYVLTGEALNGDSDFYGLLWLGNFYRAPMDFITIYFNENITSQSFSEPKKDLRKPTTKEMQAIRREFKNYPDLIGDIKFNWQINVNL